MIWCAGRWLRLPALVHAATPYARGIEIVDEEERSVWRGWVCVDAVRRRP